MENNIVNQGHFSLSAYLSSLLANLSKISPKEVTKPFSKGDHAHI